MSEDRAVKTDPSRSSFYIDDDYYAALAADFAGWQRDDAEIAAPAQEARDIAPPARRGCLPEGHQRKHTEEHRQPNQRLIAEDDITHAGSLRRLATLYNQSNN